MNLSDNQKNNIKITLISIFSVSALIYGIKAYLKKVKKDDSKLKQLHKQSKDEYKDENNLILPIDEADFQIPNNIASKTKQSKGKKFPHHEHYLQYNIQIFDGAFMCDGCNTLQMSPGYSCDNCALKSEDGYNICQECMLHPPSIEASFSINNHSKLLNKSQIQKIQQQGELYNDMD